MQNVWLDRKLEREDAGSVVSSHFDGGTVRIQSSTNSGSGFTVTGPVYTWDLGDDQPSWDGTAIGEIACKSETFYIT